MNMHFQLSFSTYMSTRIRGGVIVLSKIALAYESVPFLQECPQDRPSNAKPMSNWLQCREVLHDDAGGVEGTICGKWRR